VSAPKRLPPLMPALALAAALPWLAGCDGGDPFVRGVSRAPVIEIVPGVAAPSAPVITVLRTKKVQPPPPADQPEDMDEPPAQMPTAAPQAPQAPPPAPRQPRG